MQLAGKSTHDLQGTEYLPVVMHLRDTEGICRYLIDNWLSDAVIKSSELPRKKFRQWMRFLCLTHDIGKMTYGFQAMIAPHIEGLRDYLEANQLSGTTGVHIRHDKMGELILNQELHVSMSLAEIVGAHHGTPHEIPEPDQEYIIYGEYLGDSDAWRKIRKDWFEFILDFCELTKEEVKSAEISKKAQTLLCAFLSMSDWMASNTMYFPLVSVDDPVLDEEELDARAEYAWDQIQLSSPWEAEKIRNDDDFREVFGFLPNPVQEKVIDLEQNHEIGLLIIETQMGGGKTEAALAAAQIASEKRGCQGIYFGLPSQATANGLFPRITSWIKHQKDQEMHTVELMHQNAFLNPDYRKIHMGEDADNLYTSDWLDRGKLRMLSDFGVGTVDQVLMAALQAKYGMFRLLGLAGKTVIIDECHSYDAYMNVFLDRCLSWLGAYKVPVILLSATLPKNRRIELVKAYFDGEVSVNLSKTGYPLLTWTENDNYDQVVVPMKQKSASVSLKEILCQNAADSIIDDVSDGGCIGVIVNTVKKAQALYSEVRSKTDPSVHIILYHSGFTKSDRARKEQEILQHVGKASEEKDRNRVIIIGTQVLEQSLDIDFDRLYTEVCPMDLLFQRIGRLHRHENHDPMRPARMQKRECFLIYEDNENKYGRGTGFIYDSYILDHTLELLQGRKNLSVPDDIQSLVDLTYQERHENSEYLKYKENIGKEQGKACGFAIKDYRCLWRFDQIYSRYLIDGDAVRQKTVRDTKQSLECILVDLHEGSALIGDTHVFLNEVPSEEQSMVLQESTVKLPSELNYHFADVIKDLDTRQDVFRMWHKCRDLSKDQVYFLSVGDVLAGYEIDYSFEMGVTCRKVSEEDESGTI